MSLLITFSIIQVLIHTSVAQDQEIVEEAGNILSIALQSSRSPRGRFRAYQSAVDSVKGLCESSAIRIAQHTNFANLTNYHIARTSIQVLRQADDANHKNEFQTSILRNRNIPSVINNTAIAINAYCSSAFALAVLPL